MVADVGGPATADFFAGLNELDGGSIDDQVLNYFRTFYHRLRGNAFWRMAHISNPRFPGRSSAAALSRARDVSFRETMRIKSAGLSTAAAARAYVVLSAYTRGYVLVQHYREMDLVASAELHPVSDDMEITVPGDVSGDEVEARREIHAIVSGSDGADPSQDFEIGLLALWNGLKEELASSPADPR